MDSNVVYGDIKKISDFNSKMNKNSRSIQNIADESLDRIYRIKNKLSDRICSLSSEEISLEDELDAAYRALDYAREANANTDNPQPIPDYYYTRIEDINRRLKKVKNELSQLEKINEEFQESIAVPLKKVEEAKNICLSKIEHGADFINRYIGKLEELQKATVGHLGAETKIGYSMGVDGGSIDTLTGMVVAEGSSAAVERMLSELDSYHDVVDYDAEESVSSLLTELNVSDDEPVSQNRDEDATTMGSSEVSENIEPSIRTNSGTQYNSATNNNETKKFSQSGVGGGLVGTQSNNIPVSHVGANGGTLLQNLGNTKFLAFKATMGNFACKETVDDVEKYGVVSFGCNSKVADDWGNMNYDDWMKKNRVIEDDVRFYTGTGHSAIRGYLDGTGSFSSEVVRIERNLHAGLQNASLPNDIIMYRAISADALNKMVRDAGVNGKLGSGFILHDKSYLSCSIVANNNFNISRSNKVIFRIAAQKGQHAAYVNKWSSVPVNEYEMLVDKGSYIYVHNCYYVPRKAVTGTGTDDDIVLIVDGELIQK